MRRPGRVKVRSTSSAPEDVNPYRTRKVLARILGACDEVSDHVDGCGGDWQHAWNEVPLDQIHWMVFFPLRLDRWFSPRCRKMLRAVFKAAGVKPKDRPTPPDLTRLMTHDRRMLIEDYVDDEVLPLLDGVDPQRIKDAILRAIPVPLPPEVPEAAEGVQIEGRAGFGIQTMEESRAGRRPGTGYAGKKPKRERAALLRKPDAGPTRTSLRRR